MKSMTLNAALVAAAVSLAAAADARTFDTVALVDSLDFATIYDIETDKGNLEVLDHVRRNHVNDVWWRDKGGGLMRYPSACESWQYSETPFDKRRLPCEDLWGNLRLDMPRANPFPLIREACRKAGLKFGIHTTTEENHWCSHLSSNWTLEHPQYWSCTREGVPFMGMCGYSNPEVVAHKLEMVDERLAYKPQTIFLDTWRHGDWFPSREYTVRAVADWKKLYGCEPPADSDDPRWRKLIESYVMDYLRQFSAKCRAAGVRFVFGCHYIDGRGDKDAVRRAGVDWKDLAREGLIDAFVVMGVRFGAKDPFGDTERLYRYVMENRGKAEVYFPVCSYNFFNNGIAAYAKQAKVSPAEVVRRLMQLAWDAGGCGVVFECVDHGNYSDAECDAIAEMLRKFGQPVK